MFVPSFFKVDKNSYFNILFTLSIFFCTLSIIMFYITLSRVSNTVATVTQDLKSTGKSLISPIPMAISTESATQKPTVTIVAKEEDKKNILGEKTNIENQESAISFGVAVKDFANRFGELSNLEQQLEKPISTVSVFKQFGAADNNVLSLDDLSYIKSKHMGLLIAWEPWNPSQGMDQTTDYLKEIPLGLHNEYLKQFATLLKEYGDTVIIRFGHEMNGNWYPWGNRAFEYKLAYRYIASFFKRENVQNVKWMWCINSNSLPLFSIENTSSFYPGNDVVDMIGIDGFNWGEGFVFSGWRSFKDIFLPAYNFVVKYYRKPIVIAEVASSEIGGDKPLWITSMLRTELPTYFPKVSEIIWFNELKEVDWRIQSSDSSLKAFVASL